MKMKVGRSPDQDMKRVAAAREAIGPNIALMVDANGVFSPEEALAWIARHEQFGISYFTLNLSPGTTWEDLEKLLATAR